jgi:leader peptidase (prepilin peptidase)/N-methyltransferase
MTIYTTILIFTFLTGAAMGSFANVVIYRVPAGRSIVSPASACPGCETPIRWYDNIPVASWFFLGGKCRDCGMGISARYPLVELLTAVLFVGVVLRLGVTVTAAGAAIFAWALVVVTFIDLDHRIIPNVITFPGMAAALLFSFSSGHVTTVDALIGLAGGGGFLYLVAWVYLTMTRREGMGMGDVKLLGLIGAFLGWQALPVTIMTASLTGSLVGLVAMRLSRADTTYAVPFGPFLSLGALVHLFAGREIILWYLGRMN